MNLTPEEEAVASRMHLAVSVFLEITLPDGVRRYHDGAGRVEIGGRTWFGITDPFGTRAAVTTSLDDPKFGTAPGYVFAIVGCDVAFIKYMRQEQDNIEGLAAKVYFAAFDQETLDVAIALRCLARGKITGVTPIKQGIGTRTIVVTVESIWAAQNFPFGKVWSGSGQARAHLSDRGGEWIGVKVTEQIK